MVGHSKSGVGDRKTPRPLGSGPASNRAHAPDRTRSRQRPPMILLTARIALPYRPNEPVVAARARRRTGPRVAGQGSDATCHQRPYEPPLGTGPWGPFDSGTQVASRAAPEGRLSAIVPGEQGRGTLPPSEVEVQPGWWSNHRREGGGVMAAQRQEACGMDQPPTTSPPLQTPPQGQPTSAAEPGWLWESVRYQFWRAADLDRSIRHLGPFTTEQGEAIAYWWSLLAAVEGLGPRAYAAAFVGATERRDSEQVRWSLLAMLRDELQHEQLCRLALERFAPGWPRRYAPRTPLGRRANRHLDRVHQQAECCWQHYQRGLTRHGLPVATGALLLSELAAGALYDRWADGCAIPALATALRHTASDARRHQAVLRALAARDWPSLAVPARAEAAVQVQATT